MRLIAHRGNTSGPNIDRENAPDYIFEALQDGYDVEIDVWLINDKFFFGHDAPQYPVTKAIIDAIGFDGWFHCKNIDALNEFTKDSDRLNYFWHQEDDFTLTSHDFIWTYPGKELTENSILVMPESIHSGYIPESLPYGICSDYVKSYRDLLAEQL